MAMAWLDAARRETSCSDIIWHDLSISIPGSLSFPPLVVEGGETGIEVGDLYDTIKYDVKYMTWHGVTLCDNYDIIETAIIYKVNTIMST